MYNVCPYNMGSSHGISNVRLADCTLRDGEQQAGIVFNKRDKVEIAKWLDKMGVFEIEAGMPAVSSEDYEALAEISSLGLKAKVSALARARTEDIEMVKRSGAWGLRISLPSSPLQRRYKLKKSDEEVLSMALRAAECARESALHVIFSPFDTTRCDLPFLVKLLEELSRRRLVDRVRLVDTVGSALPSAIGFLVRVMREATCGIPIEIHCHNDFGMALASTIEGVLAGCEYVSCTMNGLGARCGNVALEEVALVLELLYGISTGIDLKYLHDVAQVVERLSGVTIHPHKAVVGPYAFAHEAGVAVQGVLKNPFTSEAYDPELVGQKRRFVLGKQSGIASIRSALDAHGLQMSDDQARLILEDVKKFSLENKRAVTDEDFLAIANKYKS